MKPAFTSPARLLLLAGLLLLGGCDTVTDDIVLSGREVVFRFEVTSQELQSGAAVVSENAETIDLDGFGRDEILSATVTGASIERILPLDVDLSFLSEAEVALTASGLSSTTVARRTGFPASAEASLTPTSGTDVGSHLSRSAFRAELLLDADAVRPNEVYELWVTLTFRVTIEGV